MIYNSSKPSLVKKDEAHQPLNLRPFLTIKKKLKLKKIKKRINKIFTKRFGRNKNLRKHKENNIHKKLIINDNIKIQKEQKPNENINIIKDKKNIENHDDDESKNILNKINDNLNNNIFHYMPNLIENTLINSYNNNDNNILPESFEEISSSIYSIFPRRSINIFPFEDYYPNINNEFNIINNTNNNININYNNFINNLNIDFTIRPHSPSNNREGSPFRDQFPFLNNNKLKDKDEIKSIKENLSKIKINKKIKLDINKQNCCICLEDFKYGQNIYSLPCSHIFHVHCLNKEIKMRRKCPLCRKELNGKNNK